MAYNSSSAKYVNNSLDVEALLASPLKRTMRRLPVDLLWSRWGCRRYWGEGVPSPARIVGTPAFQECLNQGAIDTISYEDTIEDHSRRILRFISLYESKDVLPPLVVGPTGAFLEGAHRLTALYLMGCEFADVLDFSTAEQELSDGYDSIEKIFDPTWISVGRNRIAQSLKTAKPYSHLFLPKTLHTGVADAVLGEYKGLPWKLTETDFYEQYEITLLDYDEPLEKGLKALRASVLSYRFAKALSEITGYANLRVSDIACHRSTAGQQIGIHTDYLPHGEVCRLTLHFNPGWEIKDGGFFVTFAGPTIDSAVGTYPPTHNSAILFKISSASYHAVTPVDSEKERYSMVIAMTSIGGLPDRK